MARLIAHIGLGKTATTTLQLRVFPELAGLKGVDYNPSSLMDMIKRGEPLTGIKQDTIISHEGLVDWNPRNWDLAASRNLRLFGEEAVIVIVLRDPVEYLTSVYQQKIQEGNILRPDEFLIYREEYNKLLPWLSEKRLERFDVDSLDYQKLINAYRSRFKTVCVIPFSTIGGMDIWEELFNLSLKEKQVLIDIFKSSFHFNLSYSKTAMSLTFTREKLFNVLGFRSIGSNDLSDPRKKKYPLLDWRWWMQGFVDKFFPYKKFRLGNDVYLNADLIKKNRELIESLKDLEVE